MRREQLFPEDLAALLSPSAVPHLEEMAQRAHRLTRRQFGRTIGLYAPIYLSNICTADCTYCAYARRAAMPGARRTLTPAEIRAECASLAAKGFQAVLLLSGDAPRAVPIKYLARAVALAREYFAAVSVEVYALSENEYRTLVDCGLEGVTLYMETYNRERYGEVHRGGKKQEFDWRLTAIERAGRAGARRVSLRALLGLYDWRLDGFWTALHGRYLVGSLGFQRREEGGCVGWLPMSFEARREPREGYLELPGGRLHYLDWGGSGPQAHFLHGNGFCAGTYTPFIQHLVPDLRKIASDVRGHGGSDFVGIEPVRSWKIFAEDLKAVVAATARPPIIGMGHSLGAVATCIAAAVFPDLFRAIVLVDPVFLVPRRLAMIGLMRVLGLAGRLPRARAA